MPLKFLDDSGYGAGMIRDTPSWLIPKGGVYDSLNMLYDRPGVARQRRGTGAATGNSAVFGTSLGFCHSADATEIEELYGLDGKAGTLTRMDLSNGAQSSVGTPGLANSIIGRPVQHFGFVCFPSLPPAGSGERRLISAAGQTTATAFTSTVLANIVANNQQITLTGADVTTNVKVGAIVTASDGAAQTYVGRVVSVDTTKKFTVSPMPTVTFNTSATGCSTLPYSTTFGGGCATSFQNRLLVGNTNNMLSVGRTGVTDRRIYYSPLPTETSASSTVALTVYGAHWLYPPNWPDLNWFEVAGSDPIIAIEPVGDQLLILTRTRPILFSGNLVTQLATTSSTITYDLNEIPGNATCISDLGVARTTNGVVWAGVGGIYAWNGREPIDITDKKINTYWRALVRGSSFALHGSAYVRGHYIVSGSSGGSTFALCCNLTTGAWTRLTGAGTDIFYGAARPTDPSQVWAARWWLQSGTAPTMSGGQVARLESMFENYVAGGSTTGDTDSTAVSFSLTTRVIAGDPETQKIQQRATARYTLASAGGSPGVVTVTAQSKIDAGDIDAASVRTLGTLTNTTSYSVSAASNTSPIAVTITPSPSMYQSGDWVDINGVLGNLNANGRWRINVTGTGTFELIGSTGSGAYTSGGTVKKLTEQDFLASSLDAGQGVSLTVASTSGIVNAFEWQGARVGFLEKQPVMSA